MINKYFSVIFGLVIFSNAYSEIITQSVEGSDITALKIFTDQHAKDSIRKYVVVKTSKISGCSKGVFVNYENNSAVYSTILAAKMAEKETLKLVADNSIKSPWGDTNYCALTSFEILYQ